MTRALESTDSTEVDFESIENPLMGSYGPTVIDVAKKENVIFPTSKVFHNETYEKTHFNHTLRTYIYMAIRAFQEILVATLPESAGAEVTVSINGEDQHTHLPTLLTRWALSTQPLNLIWEHADAAWNDLMRPAITTACLSASKTAHQYLKSTKPPTIYRSNGRFEWLLHLSRSASSPLTDMMMLTAEIAGPMNVVMKHLFTHAREVLNIGDYEQLLSAIEDCWLPNPDPETFDRIRDHLFDLFLPAVNMIFMITYEAADMQQETRLAVYDQWSKYNHQTAKQMVTAFKNRSFATCTMQFNNPRISSATVALIQTQAICCFRKYWLQRNNFNIDSFPQTALQSIDTMVEHLASTFAIAINNILLRCKSAVFLQGHSILSRNHPDLSTEARERHIRSFWNFMSGGDLLERVNANFITPFVAEQLICVNQYQCLMNVSELISPLTFHTLPNEAIFNVLITYTRIKSLIAAVASKPDPFPVLGRSGSIARTSLQMMTELADEYPEHGFAIRELQNEIFTEHIRSSASTYANEGGWNNPERPGNIFAANN